MRHIIVIGIFTLALSVVGCASTATTEAPAAAPEAAAAEAAPAEAPAATAEAAPEAKDNCCSKAKAEGKECAGCKKPAATDCCAQAKADGKDCAKCKKPTEEAAPAPAAPAPTK